MLMLNLDRWYRGGSIRIPSRFPKAIGLLLGAVFLALSVLLAAGYPALADGCNTEPVLDGSIVLLSTDPGDGNESQYYLRTTGQEVDTIGDIGSASRHRVEALEYKGTVSPLYDEEDIVLEAIDKGSWSRDNLSEDRLGYSNSSLSLLYGPSLPGSSSDESEDYIWVLQHPSGSDDPIAYGEDIYLALRDGEFVQYLSLDDEDPPGVVMSDVSTAWRFECWSE